MSKFKELFEARQIVNDADTQVSGVARTQPADTPKRRGRPPAMRSDPDFLQVTAYIRKKTHRKVKIALLEDGTEGNFSELVETLLEEWLSTRSESSRTRLVSHAAR
ncbi:MAG: hypothetical protein IPM24_16655 [Bryobacterales bacterium]|nr:hypothetical protein [Bryobacterales bacterium]